MANTMSNGWRLNGGIGGLPAGWGVGLGTLALVLAVIGLAHNETYFSIGKIWAVSVTYNHGWVIVPIVAWLTWRRRRALYAMVPRVYWPALVAVAAIELLWIAGAIAGVLSVQQFAAVALVPAAVVVLLGRRVAAALMFPLAYLVVFAVPWGEGMVPTLQDITAWMSVGLLELSGLPVFWEGRMISIPTGDFAVAEACSGVRYLIASLALGTLYAYLSYRSFWRRLLFVVAAIVVPIVANGIRAYGIIMLAHLSDMQLAVGVDHLLYGWVFFGLVMFLLFFLGTFWQEATLDTSAGPAASTSAPADRGHARSVSLAGLALAAFALGGSVVPEWSAQVQPSPSTRVVLPQAAAKWQQSGSLDDTAWVSGFTGADDIQGARYQSQETAADIELLAIHYRRETQGVELINSQNRLGGGSWQWLGAQKHEISASDKWMSIRELQLGRANTHRLIWSWYDIGGWQTTNPVVAKMIAAALRLTLQRGDATLVALSTEYGTSPADARERLKSFLRAHPAVRAPRGLLGAE